jgi:hypothetical protein
VVVFTLRILVCPLNAGLYLLFGAFVSTGAKLSVLLLLPEVSLLAQPVK